MATHSSVLAWRIPGMVGPGGHRSKVLKCLLVQKINEQQHKTTDILTISIQKFYGLLTIQIVYNAIITMYS